MRQPQKRKMTKGAVAFWQGIAAIDSDDCLYHGHGTTSHADGYLLATMADGTRETVSAAICRYVNGPRPSPKHQAAHNCGHANCIAPRHLRWATAKENAADKQRHGTFPEPRNNVRPRVRHLAGAMAALGVIPQAQLAEQFDVTPRTIRLWASESK